MSSLTMKVDTKRCIGCQACEVVCKQEYDLPVGPRWIRVEKIGPRKNGEKLEMQFVPVYCEHCADPLCVKVCPEGAISKRSDGIVLVDSSKCTGCKLCIDACPSHAPQFNPEQGVVGFCNYCVHRVDQGLAPACTLACPARCMYFGEVDEVERRMKEKSR
jgi:Fe-S-cluster-containing dehydrogenase component